MAHSLRTDAYGFSVVAIAVVSAATHAAVAGASDGAMMWVMAAMAGMCLAGLGQLRRSGEAVRRVSIHLSVMCGGMALAHAAWLLLVGGQSAGHQGHTVSGMSVTGSHASHMLGVIFMELICMVAAAYVARRSVSHAGSLTPPST